MSEADNDPDCVSKRPWSEVLNRSLKLFTFNLAREGGRSVGKVIFYVILGLVVLTIAAYIIDSITGWFSSWFDFWPFNREVEEVAAPEEDGGWFSWGRGEPEIPETPAVPEETGDEVRWYCKWNPIC